MTSRQAEKLSALRDEMRRLIDAMRITLAEYELECDTAQAEPDEAALSQMMRDPRYWRDRDPELVARVTEGFQRLYPS